MKLHFVFWSTDLTEVVQVVTFELVGMDYNEM